MRPLTIALIAALALPVACKKDKPDGAAQPDTPPATDKAPPPASADPRAAANPAEDAHKGHRHEPSDPYYCSMHAEETAKEAGATCPVCQMEMVRREK